MIKYKLLKDYGLVPKSITKDKSAYIIDTDDGKYVVKEKETNLVNTFKYLSSRGFNYFPNYDVLDNYMIYDYIEPLGENLEEKLEDLAYLISLLHLKTTRYDSIDIDDYKKIYENLSNHINDVYNYYSNLNDQIDNDIYMSPSYYLLVRNVSTIYSALTFSKEELDNWYELVKNNDKQRKVLIHNNLEDSHLIKNTSPYLISFNKSKIDIPIYDLYNLYNKYYNLTNFSSLLNIYQNKYPLNSTELKLFFILISIPDKIEFKNDEYINTNLVKSILLKLNKSDSLIKPFYKKKIEKEKT